MLQTARFQKYNTSLVCLLIGFIKMINIKAKKYNKLLLETTDWMIMMITLTDINNNHN